MEKIAEYRALLFVLLDRYCYGDEMKESEGDGT
jgi:hypothetical protein